MTAVCARVGAVVRSTTHLDPTRDPQARAALAADERAEWERNWAEVRPPAKP